MSDASESGGGRNDPDSCSHDEAYRVSRSEMPSGAVHCTCGRCGSGLWIVDDTVLETERSPKVVNFWYRCNDCGERFPNPSGAMGHGCGD